ncbi:MAG TPA: phosphate signaling complex protein PhoU [Halothiobacillaceae bacterium]|nr:phosphate signaling complex protein PhoU [Halothiobacillaceae bacterium]
MSDTSDHLLGRYDQDLSKLRAMVSEMGLLSLQHLNAALRGLLQADLAAAEQAFDGDERIDRLETLADELIVQIVVRYSPTAGDLRSIMSITKAITDIERIGDKSAKLGRLALLLGEDLRETDFKAALETMAMRVVQMLEEALKAFENCDQQLAEQVIEQDDAVNHEYNQLHRRLLAYMNEHPENPDLSLRILQCMRALERIGDHCCNIAEFTLFASQGVDQRHQPGDGKESTLM